MKLKQKLQHQ